VCLITGPAKAIGTPAGKTNVRWREEKSEKKQNGKLDLHIHPKTIIYYDL
jgi:hypothetical protein